MNRVEFMAELERLNWRDCLRICRRTSGRRRFSIMQIILRTPVRRMKQR